MASCIKDMAVGYQWFTDFGGMFMKFCQGEAVALFPAFYRQSCSCLSPF